MTFSRDMITLLELDLDTCLNTYGVLPCTASGAAGTECYNSIKTCQDKPNFTRGTKTIKFCTRGGAALTPLGENFRPYIESVRPTPTNINLEEGLARRGKMRITLVDEPDSDVQTDPYVATRSQFTAGTFFTRLVARNPNSVGRFARVRRGYFTNGWDASELVDELYVIENISGPNSQGKVTVTLVDPIKLTDRKKLPAATEGVLAADITAASTSITLAAGQGANYGSAGFIRIGKEVMEFTSRVDDTLSMPDLTYRGRFRTDVLAHTADSTVQLCQVWQNQPITTVLQDILELSGIATANIDVAGFALEESGFLGTSHNITTVISVPTDASKLLAEIAVLVRGYIWWSPTAQKVKFKVLGPVSPGTTVPLLTDTGNWVKGSTNIEVLDDIRTNFRALYYDLNKGTDNIRERENFRKGKLFFDADAASDNEYGDDREKVDFSRWWNDDNDIAANAEVVRAGAYYRDAPKKISGDLDAKDHLIVEGDLVDVEMRNLTDFEGAPEKTRCLVCCRTDKEGIVSLVLRTTRFSRNYGFIAPAGTPDAPNNNGYAVVGPQSDGSPDYLIF